MNKKCHIHLAADERTMLEQIVRPGASPALTQNHARILLKADHSEAGPTWRDQQIAEALEVSVATVERVRRLWATQGCTVAMVWETLKPALAQLPCYKIQIFTRS